jgi:hypothetical protein
MANATNAPYPAVTPLTLPCTVLQLRNWLKEADGLLLADNTSTITPTATSIYVSG